ncbi:MAG: hypothetical protein HUJ83_10680 [Veillonella sp.]|nr:hypothetical protein [Veillonella sp.]
MNAREFFTAVCKMRKLQKHYAKYGDIDQMTKRNMIKAEEAIDAEIKRVEVIMREMGAPKFFET